MKTKEQIFREGFGLFINNPIPDDIFNKYMDDIDGEGTLKLQSWIINNVRGEIIDWVTGIGIIESVELLYESAIENGNVVMELMDVDLAYNMYRDDFDRKHHFHYYDSGMITYKKEFKHLYYLPAN